VWTELTKARGAAGRDALWQHPDIVPGEEAFADPALFAGEDLGADTMDDELARLIDNTVEERNEERDGGPDDGAAGTGGRDS
jgi:hypothetical protein